jgi:adenine-specific DNA-methyltransferase
MENILSKTIELDNFDKIKKIIGNPHYETKECMIFNMDCVKALDLLNENKITLFNLVITSPPYNIGKEYEENMPINEYVSWCVKWIQLIYTICDKNASFWLNLGYLNYPEKGKALPISYLLWDKIPFYLIQEIVWNYGAGVACKNYFSPRNEKFLWYVKNEKGYTFNLDDIRDPDVKYPNQKKNGKLRVNPLGKNPSDVWQIPKVTSGRASEERTSHPAQFPIEVIKRIILGSSNENDLILDPFMGSGTTAEVAISTRRKVIGFEINKEYCEIIKNRLESFNKNNISETSIGNFKKKQKK